MPRYVRPRSDAHLERIVNAFGNLTRVAIIGYLASNGPATRGEVASGLEIGVATAKHNLQLLADEGVVMQDPPASEERSGMRVRYGLVTVEVEQRYAELGEALGLKSIQG
ncbi:helix-turn-helix domain-containing protein [Pseudarthrobacter sp. WHRI 8279]|uniref:helix-turn-helix domain-containing protein n=1 Tax=Pseudarthrobacter sp. WHRI 8279 TaxID=3162566 RepID=UPI0035A8F487